MFTNSWHEVYKGTNGVCTSQHQSIRGDIEESPSVASSVIGVVHARVDSGERTHCDDHEHNVVLNDDQCVVRAWPLFLVVVHEVDVDAWWQRLQHGNYSTMLPLGPCYRATGLDGGDGARTLARVMREGEFDGMIDV